MKNTLFLSSFKYLSFLGIFLIVSLIFSISSINTVSAALSNSQQISINNELSKYKKYIAARPNQFKTQESINQFYKKLKIALINKMEILNGVIDLLPVETIPSLPTSTCLGTVPTGVGVIKSTNLTSFGGGTPSWSYNDTYTWNGTDAGISCVWKCFPGYSRSGNTCIPGTNTTVVSITIQQGVLYCGDPDKSNYTIYSPINKIVILSNDSIVSCNSKGGKVWTKSSNGTIENIKNISDVKNGDIFSTNTTVPTNPTCSGITPSGVGVIKSTNLTSFGGGTPYWNYNDTYSWNGTDAGISCVWKCSTGYTKSGNGCVAITNPITTQPTCAGTSPTGVGVIKSTSTFGMVGSDSWSYVVNTRGNSTDLGISCQWTCSPGYGRSGNTCIANTATIAEPTCSGMAPSGIGVIKSTNLTSFGGGGVPSWSFVDNTRGTNTDLGISCAWTCSPGYTRSGNSCVINNNPRSIWTDSSLNTEKSYYKFGEKLYGYIQGGDINNTWACIDPPDSVTSCTRSTEFRKLTLETNNIPDEWQFNQATGRIELRSGLIISSGFPAGIYISHTRTGQNGANTTTSFVVSQ